MAANVEVYATKKASMIVKEALDNIFAKRMSWFLEDKPTAFCSFPVRKS